MNWTFLRTVAVNVVYVSLLMLGIARYNHASEFIVMSVIHDFPMKAGDTIYRDFYINAGAANGLRKGLYIEASRKLSAFDNINSKLVAETPVKIARLKLIHVDKNVSIARLVKFYDRDTTPLAGIDSVMIGDLIEVAEKQ